MRVVTTTGIIKDLVKNVAGNRAQVTSLVPEGGDPHSYEPSLRDVRDIAYADIAFSNYLMLEEQNLIKALDTNLRKNVPNIALAEDAVKYAAEIIPLVEDVTLDTIWLGLRVQGKGEQYGANRSSQIILEAQNVKGPGTLTAYLTGSFGDVDIYFNSKDGFNPENGYKEDSVTLPPDAHTHLSWAFTKPGIYTLELAAKLKLANTQKPIPIAQDSVTFAVGVDPFNVPGKKDATVLTRGHSDLTVNLDENKFEILLDHEHGTNEKHQEMLPLNKTVIEVPNKALHTIPGETAYRFLGKAGNKIFQLPQAVLGKHVHGEIDPHLWQNVRNAMSYTELIRDTLIESDPAGAIHYTQNAKNYLQKLENLDEEIRETIAKIPKSSRTLVTTHDAFGYLAKAYGLSISGFVSPSPAVEPSLAERRRLTETIRNLKVPAVFLEPNLRTRSSTLIEVAKEQNIKICPIYGDAFSKNVTNYIDMMRYNANSLLNCLGSKKGKTK